MRQNRDGVLYTLNYGEASSVAVDPIEKKPLFHFYPGSEVFSVGGWGCNFHCLHCQNWEIACADVPSGSRYLSPEQQVQLALEHHCAGIAWTYNEPTMWFEYTLDCARLARQHGLYTVYVTNGFMTPEALDELGPWLDCWRVDVKGFNSDVYSRLARIRGWKGILDVAVRARRNWDMHVEVVTNVIPGWNDDDTQIGGIARWIAGELGELTPWHVTRFFPMNQLRDVDATPLGVIRHAVDAGKAAGLKFVYSGNVGNQGDDTVCYSCGRTAVKRNGYRTAVQTLHGSVCTNCGANLNFRSAESPKGYIGGCDDGSSQMEEGAK